MQLWSRKRVELQVKHSPLNFMVLLKQFWNSRKMAAAARTAEDRWRTRLSCAIEEVGGPGKAAKAPSRKTERDCRRSRRVQAVQEGDRPGTAATAPSGPVQEHGEVVVQGGDGAARRWVAARSVIFVTESGARSVSVFWALVLSGDGVADVGWGSYFPLLAESVRHCKLRSAPPDIIRQTMSVRFV